MDKKELRVLMKHCFLTKKIAVEAKVLLNRHYLDYKWFANLKRGEMCIKGGRPKEVDYNENNKKIHKIILDDRIVKLIEIAETLKISKERVEHIVHEYLDMQKLCAKWNFYRWFYVKSTILFIDLS
jgi:hypothetical protein